MKPGTIAKIFFPFLLSLIVLPPLLHGAPDVTQIITLHSGWNSIFLDVQPEDTAPQSVFAELPADSSVWCWLSRDSRVEYIKNPSEGLWNQPGWIGYFNSPTKEMLTNLYAIFAGRPYLIFVAGSSDVILSITGTPSVKRLQWEPDSFNLVGFSVCSEECITFDQYFAASAAHAGQVIYRLDSNGQWQLVTEATSYMHPGTAYWVYSEGASKYQGPLEITFPSREGLDFSEGIVQRKVTLQNLSDATRTISILHSPSEVVLTYKFFDENIGTFRYPDINSMPAISLEPGARKTVKICVRREAMAPGESDSILRITDNGGTVVTVPVWVDRERESTVSQAAAFGAFAAPQSIVLGGVTMNNGLWVGSASLDMVSKANRRGADFYFDLQVIGRKDGEILVDEDPLVTDPEQTWKFLQAPAVDDELYPPASTWHSAHDFTDTAAPWTELTSSSPLPSDVSGTTYFRKIFTPPDVSGRQYTELVFTLQVDDGAAVYFNGKLIHVHNISALYYDVPALNEITGGGERVEFSVPATLLESGDNLIAVEVHQYTAETDDLVFGLEMKAVLTDVLLPFGSAGWSYYDQPAAPSEDAGTRPWKASGYIQQGWKEGSTPFEYEYTIQQPYDPGGPEPNLSPQHDTVYFRTTFNLASDDYDSYAARLLYDDGVVVYSNGAENMDIDTKPKHYINRLNMPDEEIDTIVYDTCPLAIRRAEDKSTYSEISLDNLVDGDNSLAVEVHQHPTEIGDIDVEENEPVGTSAPLDLRLLLHLDSSDTPRLLKEVIIMSKEDENEERSVVLLTDHAKIPDYDGIAWRDGVQISRRLSSVGFDFADEDASHPGSQVMTTQGNGLICTLSMPSSHPTNPFLHRYHPDHDNFNDRYEEDVDAGEVPAISRSIALSFDQVWEGENADEKPPGWGRSFLEGTYREVITGLHKNEISVQGKFSLRLVSEVDELNP